MFLLSESSFCSKYNYIKHMKHITISATTNSFIFNIEIAAPN